MFRLLIFFVCWLALMVGCSATLDAPASNSPSQPPNILVILADDLGIECLSLYGGISHQTPNIDRLASQGMRFTHCFSMPYCSPSRACLLTGRYPFAHGITEVLWNYERHAEVFMDPATQPSFARQLKQAGYNTALAGKWQLSFLDRHNTINAFGFDQYQCWQIHTEAGNRTTRFHQPHFNRNGQIIADRIDEQYGPDVNVAFLREFIHENAAKDKPFLAYYTCLLPHFPWAPTPDSEDQSYRPPNAKHLGDPRYFPDMVAYLDKIVGRLMDTLEEAGVADNTVVIFVADNGTQRGLTNQMQGGLEVPGGKGTMTDLGTRVPLIIRWPRHIEPGAVCRDLVDFSDFLPTLCDVTGAPLPEQPIHGRSFFPQLLGQPGNPRQWVHIQDKNQRHIRSMDYILNVRNDLRPVVDVGMPTATVIESDESEQQRATRRKLQAIFEQLGP